MVSRLLNPSMASDFSVRTQSRRQRQVGEVSMCGVGGVHRGRLLASERQYDMLKQFYDGLGGDVSRLPEPLLRW